MDDVSLQYTYQAAIGPTLGARFSLSQVLLPLVEGYSCTGPMVVDRIQNTINGVAQIFILDQDMILKALKVGSLYKKALQ